MILNLLRRHAGLLLYTALNYLDKAFAVAVPLVLLWATQDQGLYNQVEYIYALGALAVVALELGVRNYLLFGYREATDRDQFLVDGHNHFLLLNLLYAGAGLLVLGTLAGLGLGSPGLWLLVGVRTLYNALFSFYSILVRLQDRPSAVFALSLGANAGTCLLVGLFYYWGGRLTLPVVFATQALLVTALVGVALSRRLWRQLHSLWAYLRKTLAYAWPIILNVFLVVAIQNVGKLYAQNALSADEMTRIAMAQRIALIVQLGHASAAGFLAKRLFLGEGHRIERSLLLLYSGALAVGVGLSLIAALAAQHLLGRPITLSDPVLTLMVIYTVLWCYAAFLEQYLNKADQNIWIPLASITGAGVFALMLWVLKGAGIVGIAMSMIGSAIASLGLMLGLILRLKKEPSRD